MENRVSPQDLADDLDDGDVLGELLVLGSLAGDEHLALLGLNLELLESLLQLVQLGGQVCKKRREKIRTLFC